MIYDNFWTGFKCYKVFKVLFSSFILVLSSFSQKSKPFVKKFDEIKIIEKVGEEKRFNSNL